ncbi:ATP-binding protein [Bradyrhizobium sp. DASA03007]|uniref:ATP-binding protein n=1 Tax=unclassified Bradyrhizobium TaxID=2631580 RepID=UPI003F70A134
MIVAKIQIQQVALNLIRNAIEAIASCPRRELTVQVAKADMFTVADKSLGISPDIADRLSLCHDQGAWHGRGAINLPDDHQSQGGHIVAQATPGGGAIFQFTAPVAELSEET